ncbi:DUF1365 domain-containing protein [Phycicoccus endophyticus]|uniref:DUF1365 domain-containing protein n=1 Tax=Phycicoccus endophyticus TaxID=1690220 RepID=A0A7G9R1R6_9MICO|nr:DUF1365 domain-containing protein [Phycicoccus endophyticus]NHI18666.1 DUF1365 domain-containing protein [Phycicoccus endophyticus]QNN49541.1 DUF1365 domain-containing protein [Phycicoccus endophyticus]GGL37407.1 DUF1365 domain-containing protein [Phycicoccus endophyticus]
MTTVADLPPLPALVVGRVHHTRHRPFRYAFSHRHTQWLLDLDAPPRLPRWLRPLAGFRGEDHLAGAPGLAALKANVLRVLERDGVGTSAGDRVVMLAHARVLGHVFDPMSAFWVFAPGGALRAVLVEVHNTYGGRHAYVLRPGADGRAETDKDFYVSPFNDVEGEYAIRLTMTPERVGVAIRLLVGSEPLLTASVSGAPRPATTARVARTAARYPLMPQRVSGLIRLHGIRLWLRRLPVRPRPESSLESVS